MKVNVGSYLAKNHSPGKHLQDMRGKMGRRETAADHIRSVEDIVSQLLQVDLRLQLTV